MNLRLRRAAARAVLPAISVVGVGGILFGASAVTGSVDLAPAATPVASGGIQPLAARSLACPGLPWTGVDGARDVTSPASVVVSSGPREAFDSSVVLGDSGSVVIDRGDGATQPLILGRGGSAAAGVAGSGSVTVDAESGLAAGLVASEEIRVSSPDSYGLARFACTAGSNDSWLVGGSGGEGDQERLILANPGGNPVVASVEVYGAEGLRDNSIGKQVVVPAGGRSVLLLDALSPGETQPVVHVTTTGGDLVPVLAAVSIKGVTPAGLELIPPTAAPGHDQVIPAASGGSPRVLRLLAPGSKEGIVTLTAITETAATKVGEGGVVRLPAGRVVDLPLTGVATGALALRVEADVPIVAGLSVTKRTATTADFTWASAVDPITGTQGLALSGSHPSLLYLAAPSKSATVEVTVMTGEQRSMARLSIDGGTAITTALASATTSVWVRIYGDSGPVYGAVRGYIGASAPDLISTSPLVPAPIAQSIRSVIPVG